MESTGQEPKGKKRTGWKVTGYVLAVLTVLFALLALRNIIAIAAVETDDPARQAGAVVGVLIFPVAAGLLARYSFKKARS